MRLPVPGLAELAVFMGLVLVCSLLLLTVSGHFPAPGRGPCWRSRPAVGLLWAAIAVVAASAALGLAFAWLALPLYASVLAAGPVFLFAPLLLQPVPDRILNGRAIVVALAVAALALDGLAWLWLGRP